MAFSLWNYGNNLICQRSCFVGFLGIWVFIWLVTWLRGYMVMWLAGLEFPQHTEVEYLRLSPGEDRAQVYRWRFMYI